MKFPTFSSPEWLLTYVEAKNFYLEATVQTPLQCQNDDRFGIIFRAPDTDSGYFYTLTCGGHFRFSSWDGKELNTIINWKTNEAINVGPGQVNRMAIKAEINKFAFYVNGTLLGEATDNLFPHSGRFGFFIGTADTPNFIVAFDDLSYWPLIPGED